MRVAITPFEQQIELAPSILKAARARARDYKKDQTKVMRQKLKAEKMIKSYPKYGVLLDLDAYFEDPPMPGIAISDFINASYEDFVVIKNIVLAKRRTQEVTDVLNTTNRTARIIDVQKLTWDRIRLGIWRHVCADHHYCGQSRDRERQ